MRRFVVAEKSLSDLERECRFWMLESARAGRERDEAMFAAAKMADVLASVERDPAVPESVRSMCGAELLSRVYPSLRERMARYVVPD